MNTLKFKSRKTIFLSTLLIIIALSSVFFWSIGKKEAAHPKVEEEMWEEFPDGQSKIVSVLDENDMDTDKWISEKELKLRLLIAQQTKLQSEYVSVVLSVVAHSKDVSCSVVLDTDSKFEEKVIKRVVKEINNVFKQSPFNNIIEENIIVTNNNNDVLY